MELNYKCLVCGHKESSTVINRIKDWEYGGTKEFEYRRCASCSQVQMYPFLSMDELALVYPETYVPHVATASARGALYNFLFSIKNKLILNGLKGDLPPEAKAIDIGCGNGDFLISLKSLGVKNLEGVDFSDRSIALASSKGIKMTKGIFLDVPLPKETYDIAVMNYYLEHVVDPLAELKKVCLILKPGGIFFGEVPNFGSWDRKLFGRFWGGNHIPRHTFQYDPETLKKLFLKAGFQKIEISCVLDTGAMAMSVQNWLMRKRVDAGEIPKLENGRIWGYNFLLFLMIPVGIVFLLFGRSGILRFKATAK